MKVKIPPMNVLYAMLPRKLSIRFWWLTPQEQMNTVDYQSQLPENKLIRGHILYTKDAEGNMGFGVVLINHFKKWAKKHCRRGNKSAYHQSQYA